MNTNSCWKRVNQSHTIALMLLSVCLFGLSGVGHAATPVSGVIAGATWTSASSPYVVVGDITVAALVIRPGVTIQFADNYVFEVTGVLTAVGTTTDPILFTCTNAAVGWQGIFFNYGNPGSELGFCKIERSRNSGVRISSTPVTIYDCVIAENSGLPGGGLRLTGSGALVLNNCVVCNNTTFGYQAKGAGIYSDAALTLRSCTISSNAVHASGTSDYTSYAAGGGVYCLENVVVEDSLVDHNTATYSYKGWSPTTFAGGLYSGGTVYATNAIFSNNGCYSDVTSGPSSAGATGGCIYAQNVQMACCVITNNVAYADNVNGDRRWPSLAYGGGIYVQGNATILQNCLIARNSSATTLSEDVRKGGGVYLAQGRNARLINCTVVYNSGDGLCAETGALSHNTNCIFWGNGQNQVAGEAVNRYCDIQNSTPDASGNISGNPVFLDQVRFPLFSGSPCVDAGDPNPAFNDACFPPSLGTVHSDMGAYGGPGACGWPNPTPPIINVGPHSQSSCLGRSVIFVVTATSAEAMSYQWYQDAAALTGQTNATLILGPLQASHAGLYSVAVTNPYGTATSAPAQLVVNDACVDIHMYAGLTIAGQEGSTYILKYATDLSNTNFATWTPLATNTIGSSDWFYLDLESPFSPKRYYGVKLAP